mgnify:FL=1
MNDKRRWQTRDEITDRLGIAKRTLTDWCDKGKIDRVMIGRRGLYRLSPDEADAWLTGEQIAALLGVSRRTLRRRVEGGEIDRQRIGNDWLYRPTQPDTEHHMEHRSDKRHSEGVYMALAIAATAGWTAFFCVLFSLGVL